MKSTEILNLNLDYYSEYELLYEEGIRFYTNSKNVVFKLNAESNSSGGFNIKQLFQGENNIYYFSMWYGYFTAIIYELLSNNDYPGLPEFIKNWNEGKGWCGRELFESITDSELNWLIQKLVAIMSDYKKVLKELLGYINCLSDFVIFLEFVKEEKFDLRVSEH